MFEKNEATKQELVSLALRSSEKLKGPGWYIGAIISRLTLSPHGFQARHRLPVSNKCIMNFSRGGEATSQQVEALPALRFRLDRLLQTVDGDCLLLLSRYTKHRTINHMVHPSCNDKSTYELWDMTWEMKQTSSYWILIFIFNI